ncbi:MAG: hypothetical protein QM731_23605 [Chitinophagaceae bacterium]
MKKLSATTIILTIAAAISITACKKNNDVTVPQSTNDGKLMANFLKENGPQFQKFTVDATAGGTIVTTKGTKFIIAANAFVTASGAPVTGAVTVSVKEIKDASDMILGDKPTTTSDGKILISYGEFFVKAEQNNQNLQIKRDGAAGNNGGVQVQVPAKPNNQEVPMWRGDSTITTTQSGYDHHNNPVTITNTISVSAGVLWNQIGGNYAIFNGTNGTLNFQLDSLLHWVNCDALYSLPGTKTTVMGYFADHFNTSTGTNYSGEQPSMLFFKPRNQNTLIKFYNVIMSAPVGYQGLHSYQTSIPVGLEGTFLAMSSVDGKFYAEMKDVTIGTPSGTYTSVTFNPQEVSETTLLNLINQMNSK